MWVDRHFSLLFRIVVCKGKAVPLHAWSDPEGSRKLKITRIFDNGTVWW
jgi:hypothetical protein